MSAQKFQSYSLRSRWNLLLLAASACGFFQIASLPVAAEVISSVTEGGLRVQLEDSPSASSTFRMTITPVGTEVVTPSVFSLNNPPRLVVDIPNFSVKRTKDISLRSTDLRQLRFGVHPDKLRLVVDLKPGKREPGYRIEQPSGHQAVVVFGSSLPLVAQELDDASGNAPSQPVQRTPFIREGSKPLDDTVKKDTDQILSELARASKTDPSKLPPARVVTPSTVPDKADETLVKREPDDVDVTPAPNVIKKPDAAQGGAKVEGIIYAAAPGTPEPAVQIQVRDLQNYSLQKKKKNIYELTLDNATLSGSHLSLPQFPPDTFEGLEVIIARQEEQNVVLKIYVAETTVLTPYRAQGQLWIKVKK